MLQPLGKKLQTLKMSSVHLPFDVPDQFILMIEPGLGALPRLSLNHICIFSIFQRSDNDRLSVIHENPRNINNLIDNPRCK